MRQPTARPATRRHALTLGLLAAALLALPGCYEQVTRGDESIYRFAWWLGPLLIAVGVALIPLGIWLRKEVPKLGYFLLMMAPVVLLLLAPPMFHDKVIVDNDHFETTSGFWFNPKERSCRFDELQIITLAEIENDRGETSRELHCMMKSGTMVTISVGDLVKYAVDDILNRARDHDVQVIDNTRR